MGSKYTIFIAWTLNYPGESCQAGSRCIYRLHHWHGDDGKQVHTSELNTWKWSCDIAKSPYVRGWLSHCKAEVDAFVVERQPHSAAFLLYNKLSFLACAPFFLPEIFEGSWVLSPAGTSISSRTATKSWMNHVGNLNFRSWPWPSGSVYSIVRGNDPEGVGFLLVWCVNVRVFTPKRSKSLKILAHNITLWSMKKIRVGWVMQGIILPRYVGTLLDN